MKIGIYGGTFNPPHLGHLTAAAAVIATLKLDKLLLIPASIPPHKDLPAGSATAEQRLEMTRMAGEQLGLGSKVETLDMICHTAFDQPPLTRAERAKQVRKRDVFTQYGEQARKVLDALLDKYADEGIENIEDIKVLKVNPFDQFGTPTEIIKLFGGKPQYLQALNQLEQALYQAA